MKVYVVFHADIEDDRNVRGVYATRELAEAMVSRVDVTVTMHNATCLDCGGGRHVTWRTHADWCCGVDEWEVGESLPPAPEPETPRLTPLSSMELLSRNLMDDIVRSVLAKNPYR